VFWTVLLLVDSLSEGAGWFFNGVAFDDGIDFKFPVNGCSMINESLEDELLV
jgi:hypothetical protein